METVKKNKFENEISSLTRILMHIYMFRPEEAVKMAEGFGFLSSGEIRAYNVALVGNYAEHYANGAKELFAKIPAAQKYMDEYRSFGIYKADYLNLFFYDGRVCPVAQEALSRSEHSYVGYALARYPFTASNVLSMLSRRNSEALWVRIAQNKNTPPHVLAELSLKKSEKVLQALDNVIASERLPLKSIEIMCRYGSDRILKAVSKTSVSSTFLANIMRNTKDMELVENVINNPNTPVQLLKDYYDNPETRELVQSALVRRPDGVKVLEEKINIGMPMSVLTAMAGSGSISDRGVQALINLNSYTILNALSKNQSLSQKMKEAVLEELGEFEWER